MDKSLLKTVLERLKSSAESRPQKLDEGLSSWFYKTLLSDEEQYLVSKANLSYNQRKMLKRELRLCKVDIFGPTKRIEALLRRDVFPKLECSTYSHKGT